MWTNFFLSKKLFQKSSIPFNNVPAIYAGFEIISGVYIYVNYGRLGGLHKGRRSEKKTQFFFLNNRSVMGIHRIKPKDRRKKILITCPKPKHIILNNNCSLVTISVHVYMGSSIKMSIDGIITCSTYHIFSIWMCSCVCVFSLIRFGSASNELREFHYSIVLLINVDNFILWPVHIFKTLTISGNGIILCVFFLLQNKIYLVK